MCGSPDPSPTITPKYGLGTIEHIAQPCDVDFWNVGKPMRALAEAITTSHLHVSKAIR